MREVERLDAVGRLQADPQFPEQAEAMKGSRLLEPLISRNLFQPHLVSLLDPVPDPNYFFMERPLSCVVCGWSCFHFATPRAASSNFS